VQDATSQQVVPLLALQPGERVLDLCAAPGGKTLHMADVMGTGHLTACDVAPLKIRGLEELKPLLGSMEYEVVQLDPDGALPFEAGSFDAVLVDAPCTNSGVFGRRVEARWRVKPGDAAALAVIQSRLLDRAVVVLKPGGRIVYSTCSIDPEENEAVLAAFLERHPTFEGEVGFFAWPSFEQDGGFAAILRAP
jgi:16S rRNA (cytosine967-C5)-methyltransferase